MLKTIATGSRGNCYALMNDNKILLLDLGVSAKVIKKAVDFRISDVVGAVVSHGHSDHAKSVKDFENMGIPAWKPYIEYVEFSSHRIYHKVFGKFSVQCFPLPHNGTDNFGFLIDTDGQKILYLTDFEYCPYVFTKQKVNHILIECNYMKDLVDRDLPQYEHKVRGHCSLNTCKAFIEVNRTSNLRTVLLLHMGRETSNPDEMVAEVKKAAGTGVNVVVTRKGLEVELKESRCPF